MRRTPITKGNTTQGSATGGSATQGPESPPARRLLSLWLGTAALPQMAETSDSSRSDSAQSTPDDANRERLTDLLQPLSTISPLVAPDVLPDWTKGKEELARLFFGLNLDITGCERLFGGEANIIRRAYAVGAEHGFVPRIAIASSLGAAWAFSRFGERSLCALLSPAKLRLLLSRLPVAALRLPPSILKNLSDLNISVVGQLLLLPRSTLLTRFGPVVLERIDQALGKVEEPLIPHAPSGPLRAEKIFLSPLFSPEGLKKSTSTLLDRLFARLAEQTLKPSHLLLEIQALEAPLFRKEFVLAFPSGDPHHLWNLIAAHLEQIDLSRGVERITLVAYRTAMIKAKRCGFLPDDQSARSFFLATQECGQLLDVLSEYLGPDEMCHMQSRASHIPERSYAYAPLEGGGAGGVASVAECAKAPAVTPPTYLATERPSLLFHRPFPLQVMAVLPDRPPFWLKWRGKRYRINHARGPERIAPEWWGKDAELMSSRDYFQVQLQSGTWLWIYREHETQEWFLHGVWC